MGQHRTCDARCHNATGPACACWCAGLFHGAGGQAARETFRETYNDLAGTEQSFHQAIGQGQLFASGSAAAWREALTAARGASDHE